MKTNLLIFFLLSSIFGFSQELIFKENFDKSHKRYDYKKYISKDSTVFQINDVVKIGKPSDLTYKYIFIYQIMGYLPMTIDQNHLLDGQLKITTITVSGSKRKGYSPYFVMRNESGSFFSIDIENAIANGEVISKLSEDEILELLKKEKEKLELGIITQEEFETRKTKLLKANL